MREVTTTDFSKFSWRERHMAEKLLCASREQELPEDFEDDEITIMMNMDSGNVFFTNSAFQVAMMNGEKLESFYRCPYCGHEGFKENMEHEPVDKECTRYLEEIGVLTKVKEEEEGEAIIPEFKTTWGAR